MRIDHEVAQILKARGEPNVAHEILARVMVDEAAGGIGAEAAQCGEQPLSRDFQMMHLGGVGCHAVLAHFAADADESGDAGHRQHLRTQHEIRDLAQLHRRGAAGFGGERDQQDLAHDRGERGHLRHDAGRQLRLNRAQALIDPDAGELNVGRPAEFSDHYGITDARSRAHGLNAGDAVQEAFDRPRHQAFHLLGRKALRLGHDRDGGAREVGQHVDGKPRQEIEPVENQQRPGREHEETVAKALRDEKIEHAVSPHLIDQFGRLHDDALARA